MSTKSKLAKRTVEITVVDNVVRLTFSDGVVIDVPTALIVEFVEREMLRMVA